MIINNNVWIIPEGFFDPPKVQQKPPLRVTRELLNYALQRGWDINRLVVDDENPEAVLYGGWNEPSTPQNA